MEMRELGRTGFKVSALGFGTSELGFSGASTHEAAKLLHTALDAGVNLIDTAAAYLASESLIGEVLESRRQEIILSTKCGALEGFARKDWSAAGILRTVEASLQALRTDYVDVLFLHSCPLEEMSEREALEGVRAAKDKGYARCIGYSGDGEAALWAIRSGHFDAAEMSISIVDQEAIELLLPEARAANIGVIAKRPIGNAVWRYDEKPDHEYHVEYWRRLQALDYEFTRDGAANAAAAALRFTLSLPEVSSAIVGTTSPERFAANAAAVAAGPLPRPEFEAIRHRWAQAAQADWKGQS